MHGLPLRSSIRWSFRAITVGCAVLRPGRLRAAIYAFHWQVRARAAGSGGGLAAAGRGARAAISPIFYRSKKPRLRRSRGSCQRHRRSSAVLPHERKSNPLSRNKIYEFQASCTHLETISSLELLALNETGEISCDRWNADVTVTCGCVVYVHSHSHACFESWEDVLCIKLRLITELTCTVWPHASKRN